MTELIILNYPAHMWSSASFTFAPLLIVVSMFLSLYWLLYQCSCLFIDCCINVLVSLLIVVSMFLSLYWLLYHITSIPIDLVLPKLLNYLAFQSDRVTPETFMCTKFDIYVFIISFYQCSYQNVFLENKIHSLFNMIDTKCMYNF